MRLKPYKKIGLLKSPFRYADIAEKDERVIKITVLMGSVVRNGKITHIFPLLSYHMTSRKARFLK